MKYKNDKATFFLDSIVLVLIKFIEGKKCQNILSTIKKTHSFRKKYLT